MFILGEDVTNVAPRMALVGAPVGAPAADGDCQEAENPVVDGSSACATRCRTRRVRSILRRRMRTRLDEVATATFHAAPDDLARLGFAVAHALDSSAPLLDR